MGARIKRLFVSNTPFARCNSGIHNETAKWEGKIFSGKSSVYKFKIFVLAAPTQTYIRSFLRLSFNGERVKLKYAQYWFNTIGIFFELIDFTDYPSWPLVRLFLHPFKLNQTKEIPDTKTRKLLKSFKNTSAVVKKVLKDTLTFIWCL